MNARAMCTGTAGGSLRAQSGREHCASASGRAGLHLGRRGLGAGAGGVALGWKGVWVVGENEGSSAYSTCASALDELGSRASLGTRWLSNRARRASTMHVSHGVDAGVPDD